MDGAAKKLPVVIVIAVNEKQDGGYANYNERKYTDENDGAMYLVANGRSPEGSLLWPVSFIWNGMPNNVEKKSNDKKRAKQVSE